MFVFARATEPVPYRQVNGSGTIECSYVDSDIQHQVRALDQFRNVSFLQGKSSEDREAFRNLSPDYSRLAAAALGRDFESCQISRHRQSERGAAATVRLINSNSPLTLVLGPPGTGKTDTIAIALEMFLRRSPDARVAVVSQANVAVDEALKKLKARYPECDIVRHVSDHAVNSIMDSSKDLTQHASA